MGKKKKAQMQFRYYRMAYGSSILALLGEKWIRSYGSDVEYLHFHNLLEIGYCYNGSGQLVLGKEEYRYEDDTFSVIPRHFPHTTNSDQGGINRWEYLYVDLEGVLGELFQNNTRKMNEIVKRINSRAMLKRASEEPQMAAKVLEIMNLIRCMDAYYMEEAKAIMAALLLDIARMFEAVGGEVIEEVRMEHAAMLVFCVLDYISFHYMEPIMVGELAQMCHVSETHFRRVFTGYMKMSPLQYINTVRIQNACEYLRKTDWQVADIANRCGFTTISTFNRNFKELMGKKPLEWRKCPENYEQQLLEFNIHSEEGW
ncbi:AraC family transcriptional regulator [Roseburia hominis]